MALEDQVDLLRATLHQSEDLPRMAAQMVDTHLTGNLTAIAALAEDYAHKDGSLQEARLCGV